MNTISILQPMDQQEICKFKKLYSKHLFRWCSENTNMALRDILKGHFKICELPQHHRCGLTGYEEKEPEFCMEEAMNGIWDFHHR